MKKILAFFLVATMIMGLSACRAASQSDGGIPEHVALSDYRYEIYGEILQHEDLGDDCWVIAIRPLNEGGADYPDYPYVTAYVAEDFLISIDGMEPGSLRDRAFKFGMTNDEHGGGFISLPSVVMSVEEVVAEEIPFWSGC